MRALLFLIWIISTPLAFLGHFLNVDLLFNITTPISVISFGLWLLITIIIVGKNYRCYDCNKEFWSEKAWEEHYHKKLCPRTIGEKS